MVDYGLTERQEQILALTICGYNMKGIANFLGISIRTVNNHVYGLNPYDGSIFNKMGLIWQRRNKTNMVTKALQSGYMDFERAKKIVADLEGEIPPYLA
jgi:DNA-binding NarL/FixJ family response regulator